MKHKWNKKEILIKLLIARLFNKNENIELYNLLMTIYHDKEEQCDFNLKSNLISYDSAKKIFSSCLYYISEDLYNLSCDLFYIFNDISLIDTSYTYSYLKLTDNELIEIVYDIIATFNNPKMLRYFNYMLHNNLINIKNNSEKSITTYEKNGGITFYDFMFKKSYINMYRYNTIEDIEILLHEFFHSYFFYINKKNIKEFNLLPELEGIAGSMYAFTYLDKNGFNEANKLRCELFSSIITDSFLLMINHLLIKNNYDLEQVNLELKNLDFKDEIIITEDTLLSLPYINGFETSSNIISYLIVLDIINSTNSPEEYLNIITDLKINGHHNLKTNLSRFNQLKFINDNLDNLFKEKKLIHK